MTEVTTSEMKDILKMEGNEDFLEVQGTDQESDFVWSYIQESEEYELAEFRG